MFAFLICEMDFIDVLVLIVKHHLTQLVDLLACQMSIEGCHIITAQARIV